MSYIDNFVQSRGGFNFDHTERNEQLVQKKIVSQPLFTKTGTTIVGIIVKDAVILAADTRATAGSLVADKNCEKLHRLAPNIYCAGAGTAADLQHVTERQNAELELIRLNTGRQSRVHQVVVKMTDHLFRYGGNIGCALIIGGFDVKGPQLVSVAPAGNFLYSPFNSMGSGSLAALGILEAKYQENLSIEDGVLLAAEAIEAGIFHDLGSGSNVDVAILTKSKVEVRRNLRVYNKKVYEKQIPFQFPSNNTPYLKQYVFNIEKQELNEVDQKDQMEIIA